jgi:hypothetical protein
MVPEQITKIYASLGRHSTERTWTYNRCQRSTLLMYFTEPNKKFKLDTSEILLTHIWLLSFPIRIPAKRIYKKFERSYFHMNCQICSPIIFSCNRGLWKIRYGQSMFGWHLKYITLLEVGASTVWSLFVYRKASGLFHIHRTDLLRQG